MKVSAAAVYTWCGTTLAPQFLQGSVYRAAAVFAVSAAEHPIVSVLSHQMALLCPNRFLMEATRHQVWRVPGSKKTVKEK